MSVVKLVTIDKASIDWIESNEKSLVEISDKIWKFAELGLVEFKSSALLCGEFEKHGFKVEKNVAGMPTCFIATFGGGKPTIGIMGEYDALPGMSQKPLPLEAPIDPEKPGHGCGHNIHGTSGAAAAIAVAKALKKQGKGTIRFFGCPAEENFSSKVFMVRDGYFDDVDAVISHHPDTMNAVTLKSCLAVNSTKFHFHGKATHAAGSPEHGRSALDAVELMNIGANYMREHIIQEARLHYVVEKGGGQPNVVPPYARSWYYIRAPERDQVESIYNWLLDIAKAAAMMSRTSLDIEFIEGSYNVIPNRIIAEAIVHNMRKVGLPSYDEADLEFGKRVGETITREMKISQLQKSKRPHWERLVDKLIDEEIPGPWGDGEISYGSTDVADVSWQIPTVEFGTATYVLGTPAHSWQAVAQSAAGIGHKSLIFAAKVMATTAIDLMSNQETLKAAKKEHKQRLANRKYRSPLQANQKPPLDIWQR
ncbi:MAG: amidohydrolase [Candidatus Bathyarchaeota archaeon]|jgi:aminobenzoyl-glutamate utilization protein B|nr:MAG: amidohydrolase [Candidatus Bathyarchaeota archaeon]